MRHLLQRKSFVLIVGIISILLLVFLAAGMDSLEFKKGTPFSYVDAPVEKNMTPADPPDMNWLFVLVIAVYLVFMALALMSATPKQRRRFLLVLLAMTLALLAIMWWVSRSGEGADMPAPTPTVVHTPVGSNATLLAPEQSGTQVVYEQPKISPWISIGITFSALFVVALLVWLFLRFRLRDNVPLDTLAEIAEQTVNDLQAGKDYGDAVITCYANMVLAVNKQRGIRRRGNLTPAEFIAVLERARLPSASVRRLTALFERVRYGGKKPSQKEIDEAVACLSEIVAAIREAL
jgi:hypothetical protein